MRQDDGWRQTNQRSTTCPPCPYAASASPCWRQRASARPPPRCRRPYAEPNNGGGAGGKSCKLPGGKTIDSGNTGTDYGSNAKTYECKDGIACQVEGGKTTDKCSHTGTIIKVTRGNRVQGTATVSARL